MKREALRTNLLRGKDELEDRLKKISVDIKNRKISRQFDEQSVERENDLVLVNLELEAKEELNHIDKALARIDTEYFDKCQKCGEVISNGRLQAVPYATKCADCAE